MKADKHAVLIGLNNTIGLEPLHAAVESAVLMKDWAEGQGFQTHLFVDTDNKVVKAEEIVDRMEGILEVPPTQLLVYFSGHGCIKSAGSELWFLSNVLRRGEEAFDLNSSKMSAYESGVKNVIFISDACRSAAEEYPITLANGRSIMPNMKNRDHETKIDMLYASWPGDPAYEIRQNGGDYKALYSECLLDCLNGHIEDVIRPITDPQPGILAVMPYDLSEYLRKNLPRIIVQKQVFFKQQPMGEVNSREPIYISKIDDLQANVEPEHIQAPWSGGKREVYLEESEDNIVSPYELLDNVKIKLEQLLTNIGDENVLEQNRRDVRQIKEAARRSNFEDYFHLIREDGWSFHKKGHEIGLAINGGQAINVYGSQSSLIRRVDAFPRYSRDGVLYIFEMMQRDEFSETADIVIAQVLKTRVGFPIALIPGFYCSVNLEGDTLVSVDYIPLAYHKFDQWRHDERRIAERKATIISAAKHGIFQAGSEIGTYLRRLKHLDPILGLFAAYAYAQNGDFEDVQSVYNYVMNDDGASLFDIDLLRRVTEVGSERNLNLELKNIPLLTQGFSYLPMIYDVEQSRILSTMLKPGLWTTFQPQGVEFLVEQFNLIS